MTSPYTPEEIRARIQASADIGVADFLIRGGFSKENAFYLSFVKDTLPEGQQWVGGTYIRADSPDEALVLSKALEINPGGHVSIMGPAPANVVKLDYYHRLLTSKEDLDLAHNPEENTVFD